MLAKQVNYCIKYKVIVAKFKLLVKAHKKLYNCNMSSQEQLKKNVNHKDTLFQLVFGRAEAHKMCLYEFDQNKHDKFSRQIFI